MRILVVCTGNLCRSPLAAALLRRRLDDADVDARVDSAGLRSEGRPAEPSTVAVGHTRGVDLSAHRSRRIAPDLLDRTDLVLGMARDHVRAAVAVHPDAWPYTFTLKELARRARGAGPRPDSADLPAWLRHLSGDRAATDLLGASPDDDVPDPIGAPVGVFERIAANLDHEIEAVVAMLWPRV